MFSRAQQFNEGRTEALSKEKADLETKIAEALKAKAEYDEKSRCDVC